MQSCRRVNVDLIVNRQARRLGAGSALREVLARAAASSGARLHETHSLEELERVAREMAARGTDAVVLAGGDGSHMGGLSPTLVIVALVSIYFFSHYFFSSLTAHTTAMMPIMLGVGLGIPGLPPEKLAIGLALTTGIMGVISPYATGAALPYYNSGYITSAEFWRNGTVYGMVFLAALIVIGLPLL